MGNFWIEIYEILLEDYFIAWKVLIAEMPRGEWPGFFTRVM